MEQFLTYYPCQRYFANKCILIISTVAFLKLKVLCPCICQEGVLTSCSVVDPVSGSGSGYGYGSGSGSKGSRSINTIKLMF